MNASPPIDTTAWPTDLYRAASRWGHPILVDMAKQLLWSQLVNDATEGKPTLLLRSRPQIAWAVLVPLSELYQRQWNLHHHSASDARGKLGSLIEQAQHGQPQLLMRYNRAVAAIMSADMPVQLKAGQRLTLEQALDHGLTITMQMRWGWPCDNDPDNPDPGVPDLVVVTAKDVAGNLIADSAQETLQAALDELRRPYAEPPLELSTESPPF